MRCVTRGNAEELRHTVIRMIRDCRMLFPRDDIKMKNIMDWTNNDVSIYKTRKIIEEFAGLVPRGKKPYYLFNKNS